MKLIILSILVIAITIGFVEIILKKYFSKSLIKKYIRIFYLFIITQIILIYYSFINHEITILLCGLFFTVGFIFLLLYGLYHKVFLRLENLIGINKHLSEGDLNWAEREQKFKKNDEIGTILSSLKFLFLKLQEFLTNINFGISIFNTSISELNVAYQNLNEENNFMAANVESISVASKQIKEAVSNTQDNIIDKFNVVLKIEKLLENVEEESCNIRESSHMIYGKVKLIEDIALKINIISLNASIEAVKAGENGKSFMVVSQAIKKLADSTKKLADNINEQATINIKRIDSTTNQINEISPEITFLRKAVKQIISDSSQHIQAIESIDTSLEKLNEVSQNNAAHTEELSSNVEELSGQVMQIKESASYFTIKS